MDFAIVMLTVAVMLPVCVALPIVSWNEHQKEGDKTLGCNRPRYRTTRCIANNSPASLLARAFLAVSCFALYAFAVGLSFVGPTVQDRLSRRRCRALWRSWCWHYSACASRASLDDAMTRVHGPSLSKGTNVAPHPMDWETAKFLIQAAISAGGAIGAAFLAANLAGKRFRHERWWEKKVAAYAELVDALHKMKRPYSEEVDAMLTGGEISGEKQQELWGEFNIARDNVLRIADTSSFLISTDVSATVRKIHRR